MEELAKLLKAVADKNRLRILCLLQTRKMCVCELAFVLGITQPAVSKHLKKLGEAGIVGSEQDRFWTNYRLKGGDKTAGAILSCLRKRLISDPVFKQDLRKMKKINRSRICREK
jgi:ArsR family transcriptional regulator, arsenate/arsenite/antimonite-responsive transcriptional repressor